MTRDLLELQESFLQMIEGKSISEICLGADRNRVECLMVIPQYWEGFSDQPASRSGIWSYWPLQVNFESDCVESICLFFGHGDDGTGSYSETCGVLGDLLTANTSAAVFTDLLVSIDIRFSKRLCGTNIVFLLGENVAVSFKQRLDYERSVLEERRITSAHHYLYRIILRENVAADRLVVWSPDT